MSSLTKHLAHLTTSAETMESIDNSTPTTRPQPVEPGYGQKGNVGTVSKRAILTVHTVLFVDKLVIGLLAVFNVSCWEMGRGRWRGATCDLSQF